MDRARFETLVAEALDDLPDEFRARLENVEVVVEDDPDVATLRDLGLDPRRDTLFGLYQGVPLAERGFAFGNALPDKITIYYHPLVRICRTADRIRRQVQKTVVHEIGHHFGFDDAALRREGY